VTELADRGGRHIPPLGESSSQGNFDTMQARCLNIVLSDIMRLDLQIPAICEHADGPSR
jgi:hypothetical protein